MNENQIRNLRALIRILKSPKTKGCQSRLHGNKNEYCVIGHAFCQFNKATSIGKWISKQGYDIFYIDGDDAGVLRIRNDKVLDFYGVHKNDWHELRGKFDCGEFSLERCGQWLEEKYLAKPNE